MFSQPLSLTRSGMIAAVALAILSTAAPAAPIGPVVPAIAGNSSMQPIQVQGEGRDNSSAPVYHRWKNKYENPRAVQRDRALRDTRKKKQRQREDGPRNKAPVNDGPTIILQFGR